MKNTVSDLVGKYFVLADKKSELWEKYRSKVKPIEKEIQIIQDQISEKKTGLKKCQKVIINKVIDRKSPRAYSLGESKTKNTVYKKKGYVSRFYFEIDENGSVETWPIIKSPSGYDINIEPRDEIINEEWKDD